MINRIRSASIKVKMMLMALFGLVGFSFILLGSLSFFEQINNELSSVQEVDLKVVQIASELQVGLSDLNRLFEAAVVEHDKDTLNDAVSMAAGLRVMVVKIGRLSPRLADDVGELVQHFDAYVAETKHYSDDVINGRFKGDDMYGAFSSALARREIYDKQLRALTRKIDQDFSGTMETLRSRAAETFKEQITFGTLLVLMLMFAFIWLTKMMTSAIRNVIGVAGQIADGNLDVEVGQASSEEFMHLFSALVVMRNRLKEQNIANIARQKRQSRIATLNESLRGELTVQTLGDNILHCMGELLGVLAGAFYLLENDELVMQACYARKEKSGSVGRFRMGESLVGQVGLQQRLRVVSDLPQDYATVVSGLGEALPRELLLAPLVLNGRLLGVFELMSFHAFDSDEIEFIRLGSDAMAIALHSAMSRVQLADALARTRQQAEALEQQQEELRATNEELEEQASVLRASEENLQQQQEELRVMNEELEERNHLLDRQKEEIVRNNAALERSREDLQIKAKQLEQSGRYKSEFLSTMSHELRTPLNSILILSQGLMENKPKNLNEKQVQHARVIHSSGRDLLMLINDILDLSKVEEGKFELMMDEMEVQEFANKLRAQFEGQAEIKGLTFKVSVDSRLPVTLSVDEHRLSQILRNFISNALKFTHAGEVTISIGVPDVSFNTLQKELLPEHSVVFGVKDSGIGIPLDKQDLIFEAFQQVDGTISRKYGGTGLGLTISRKLAELMGGGIRVTSEGENRGSTFSLVLPRRFGEATAPVTLSDKKPALIENADVAPPVPQAPVSLPAPIIEQNENTLLIVEDNVAFSNVLKNLATEFGFNAVCVYSAAEAYSYLANNVPASVILDLGLPDAPGQQLLDHVKSHPRTKNVPVHVISGNPEASASSLRGAEEFIAKPFGRERLDQLFKDINSELQPAQCRRVLVIEDDPVQHEVIQETFSEKNIVCDMAATGAQATALLAKTSYGAIVLDLDLPDCDGFQLVASLRQHKNSISTPIIVYTARDLTKKQDADLRRYVSRIVLKTDRSLNRLLNETTLFLHWLKGKDEDKAPSPPPVVDKMESKGQRLLLVDDDIRNLYSLSAVLEDCGLEVKTAGTGREALEALETEGGFDLVLMDIMMPEMDGFEAMQRIRADARFQKLPIIALTAKAMRDDRARCIDAGANDYLSKPVDNGKLRAIVKLWLGQA